MEDLGVTELILEIKLCKPSLGLEKAQFHCIEKFLAQPDQFKCELVRTHMILL